jgi:acetyl-CoA C-acetyltransferase
VTRRPRALVAGAYEHPERDIPHSSAAAIHAQVALGALADAGLSLSDVDGYFCAQDAPGFGGVSMAGYLGLQTRFMDTSEHGGAAPLSHLGHAAEAIAAGKCQVALITLGGLAYQQAKSGSRPSTAHRADGPEGPFELPYGPSVAGLYALAAQRHMYEFGTTSRQLAEIRVAASLHAQHNPAAVFRTPVTVDDVLESPMIADPLHRLDCCAVTDGGGALVVVSPEIAADLERTCVQVLGHGEAPKHTGIGRVDLTYTGARWSGPAAFADAGVRPADIDYVGVYDSFTITVLEALEDLGFCAKGEGGRFVEDGTLVAPDGRLPFNTDGGGLCNNHPGNRGGITKAIEAVRQLRGEAHPAVQVPDCELALAHGTGGVLGTRMSSVTVILGRDE